MIIQTVLAILIIFGLFAGWILVQHLARNFAARHPEFGPMREEGKGCGAFLCLCSKKDSCPRYSLNKEDSKPESSAP